MHLSHSIARLSGERQKLSMSPITHEIQGSARQYISGIELISLAASAFTQGAILLSLSVVILYLSSTMIPTGKVLYLVFKFWSMFLHSSYYPSFTVTVFEKNINHKVKRNILLIQYSK